MAALTPPPHTALRLRVAFGIRKLRWWFCASRPSVGQGARVAPESRAPLVGMSLQGLLVASPFRACGASDVRTGDQRRETDVLGRPVGRQANDEQVGRGVWQQGSGRAAGSGQQQKPRRRYRLGLSAHLACGLASPRPAPHCRRSPGQPLPSTSPRSAPPSGNPLRPASLRPALALPPGGGPAWLTERSGP